jgi:glucose-1-phosphate thymidylyltransferase
MKIIIPVAGTGCMLRPHTNTQPKPLVPIAGIPILGHIVNTFKKAGFREFVFIIGYFGSKIEEFIQTNYKNSIDYEFVVQRPREGLAHAIWTARNNFRNEKEIVIALGDTIVEMNFVELLQKEGAWLGVKKVDNPKEFGIAEIGRGFTVKRLVEKPKIPISNEALVGIYKINNIPLLLECIEEMFFNQEKTNGEYHLTDALMKMIQRGTVFNAIEVSRWYDCGKKDALLAANATLLNYPEIPKSLAENYTGNIIIQPVRIGDNCSIKNSIIGPNVSIGDNAQLDACIIKGSIIGTFSTLKNVVLYQSIVGSDVKITGIKQSLNIGDNTEINLSH